MIRAIIIDDENDARESLKLSLEKFCPEVSLVVVCEGPEIGLEAIRRENPDLVFLDVQMPYMSGFDLLEAIGEPQFQTIFVTAHDKYAIKAIRFSALDYLLKPVDADELVKAVRRANNKAKPIDDYKSVLNNVRTNLGQNGRLAVPTLEGMSFVNLNDIIYCEAKGAYTRIILSQKKEVLVSKHLKEVTNILDPDFFCRVHMTYTININHIDRYIKGEGGYVIMINGDQVYVSRRKKENFMKLFKRI